MPRPPSPVLLWAATAARALLGVVFVVAGVLKLPDPAAAERAVRAYQLLPEWLVPVAAFGLPVIEIVVGAALLIGVGVRAVAVGAAVLLAGYLGAIVSAWSRGLQIDCGCFSSGGAVGAGQTDYPWDVARDLGLLLAALFLVRRPHSRLVLLRSSPTHEQEPAGAH